jgi:hypothetical protein
MSTTGPVNPALVIVRAPVTGRAWRELLFCAVEVPLGLCVLVVPIALAALPLVVTLLANGGPPARSAPAHPAGVLAVLAGAVVFVLLALLFLSGLAQRVRTVDGRLEIASPEGGPTQVTVQLPLRP